MFLSLSLFAHVRICLFWPSQSLTSLARQVRKAQSWYGSWPRPPKAAASTSVARENILGGSIRSNKSSDLSRFDSKRDSDSASLRSTATKTGPDLSEIPEDAMNGNNDGPAGKAAVDKSTDKDPETNTKDNETSKPDVPVADENKSPGQEAEQPQQQQQQQPQAQSALPEQPTETTPQRPTTSSGWLGWLAKAPFTETQAGPVPEPMAEVARPKEDADHKPNTLPTSGVDEARPNNDQKPSTPPPQPSDPDTTMGEAPSNTPATTLWYDFWSKSGTKPQPEPDATKVIEGDAAKSSNDVVMEDAPPTVATPESSTKPQPSPKAGSTWAFWSRDTPKDQGTPARKESGELAVIGEGSENHPAPMAEDDVSTPSKPPKPTKDSAASTKSTWRRANKRLRPESMDIDNQSQSPTPSGVSTPQESTISVATTKVDSSSKSIAESVSAKSNLLLPSFTSTYQMKDNPSIVKQITQFLLRTQQAPANHVFRVSEHPKIRKAIAIGVHGLFPSAYLRPMIGQPTGTSLRFASLCADAIRKWADEHGCSDCEIEKVALEGEGKINERVSNLWKLMLNWIEHIRGADLIIIACHSQGVPVSVMLLEKLIDLGIITNAKIGVCAMAGVSLGPFPEYKSSLFGAPATELWDFGNPQSQNAQRFEAALKRVLDYGARITFIGSIDDQLVPLEVSLLAPYLWSRFFTNALVSVCLVLSCAPPIHLPSRLHRRPRPRPRLHRPSRRLRPQASQPRHNRPRPHPRTLPPPRRLPLLRRGPLPSLL